MKKVFLLFPALLLIFALPAAAQTKTSALSFSIGAGALGLGGSSNATPATDIPVTLNPGIAKMPDFSFRMDTLLAPGPGLQFYGGGADYQLPYLAKTGLFSKIYFTVNATFGLDRIVPAIGASQSHAAMMIGGTVHYAAPAGMDINMFQAGLLRTPGAPWGANAPYIGGSLLKTLFSSSATAAARLRARKETMASNFTPTW